MQRDNRTSELRLGQDIADRLRGLAEMALKVACTVPRASPYRHLAQQLARAGTAAGANYEGARAAESRADFIHNVLLATKELREALYWLRLARAANLVPVPLVERAIDEADQLTRILGASARTARQNAP
ncbi:MAG TPA: four helix bundle protein [Kofleriaceae bacterium]|nr:four helix bundle protein [Kofleriaceae bacterium]